ncbi:DinB family protein [Paenibacillus sp. PR3]|uniref:DinB family protein n=1 Tax=Paenibacillus terricola TaxID=2763503 RepID=A0ABR8MX33_9BACL|nr:DinB family protein [Paenibacillus terricola]MBD3919846.1 DinB family protein [Paenibacillus terricola]
MSEVFSIRDHLLHEFEHGVMTSQRLIRLIKPEQWSYRPQNNMRTLQELAHHLVMLPATDLAIMQEKQGPAFERIEGDIRSVTDCEQLCELMQTSFEAFRNHMLMLSEQDLLNLSTKAFYAEHGSLQIRWLIETLTHLFHHRAQLFNYLKQLGHDINMFILY